MRATTRPRGAFDPPRWFTKCFVIVAFASSVACDAATRCLRIGAALRGREPNAKRRIRTGHTLRGWDSGRDDGAAALGSDETGFCSDVSLCRLFCTCAEILLRFSNSIRNSSEGIPPALCECATVWICTLRARALTSPMNDKMGCA
eukprot:512374-Rhodomonas_salina.1